MMLKSPKLSRVVASIALATVVMTGGTTPAHAASDVGGLDISRYCRAVLSPSWYASIPNPSDPYGWVCRTASGASFKVGLTGLHDTCRIQYGRSAVAVLTYYSAYGWRCYR